MAIVGLVLLVVGLIVALTEIHAPTHGLSVAAGTALIAIGVVLAVTGLGAAVSIGFCAAVIVALAGGTTTALMLRKSTAVRRIPVRGGREGLIGQIGTVRSWQAHEGSVLLAGGLWRARRSPSLYEDDDDEGGTSHELHAGDRVVVERLSGLTVSVRPAEEWELL